MLFTTEHLIALLPLITLTATSIIVMLIAAFYRRHLLVATITVIGLLLTIYTLSLRISAAPLPLTPLLIADQYSLFFSALFVGCAAAIAILCHGYFKLRDGLQEELYILLLTATLGAVVLVHSAHFAGFFLGIELLSVSLFAMVAYPISTLDRHAEPIEAGIKYLILSGVSSAFIAFGICFLYAASGTLSYSELSYIMQDLDASYYAIAGVAMLIAGVGYKLSLVPFHMWTPDIYQGAPAPVTAFVATISKGAVLATLLKVFLILNIYQYQSILFVLSIIAVASMIIGNLLALLQTNIKRVIAYSSTAHLGYCFVAFLVVVHHNAVDKINVLAVEAVTYYIVAYLTTSLGVMGVISILSSEQKLVKENRDCERLSDLRGLFWKNPYLATVLIVCLLSLAGIPLTVGFIGKFYLFSTGIESSSWFLLSGLVVGSAIGLYFYLRIVMTVFLSEEKTDPTMEFGIRTGSDAAATSVETPIGAHLVLALIVFSVFCLGTYPAPLIDIIKRLLVGPG